LRISSDEFEKRNQSNLNKTKFRNTKATKIKNF
jgi:hypothetical protein